MDSANPTFEFHKQLNDLLTPHVPKLAISYAIYTLKEIGLDSWLAVSGLGSASESDIRKNLVEIMNDTGLICQGAPTDDAINALIIVIKHACNVKGVNKITQFVSKKEQIVATHKKLEKVIHKGYPNVLLCSNSNEGDSQRKEYLEMKIEEGRFPTQQYRDHHIRI